MHIAEYFPTLVHQGDPVYVIGGTPFEIVSREPIAAPAPVAARADGPARRRTA